MDGVLNIYKPSGPSSFSMVRSVRKILQVPKAGHIGTLDPLAEGVLPICLNKSTKIIQFLMKLSKVYTTTMLLGVETDTQDSTGKTVSKADPSKIDEAEVKAVLKEFEGELQQVPPMFSAKKRNGVPLYKLARNGITVERKPVPINIHSISCVKKEGNKVSLQVHCSSGTYIRTLCHDVGAKLGCGAHMLQLTRTKAGNFNLGNSITLEELETVKTRGTLSDKIFTMETVLSFLPEIRIKTDHAKAVSDGVSLSKSFLETFPEQFQPGMEFRVSNANNHLVAIAESLTDQDTFAHLEPNEIAFKLKRVFT